MLKELPPGRQPEGEPTRRWFFSHEQDLIIWFDDDRRIRGFQLCYDKYDAERAVTWRREGGFEHSVVDDGERGGLDFQTPFLHPDGRCDVERILADFAELSAEVPADIAAFVVERLQEFASSDRPGV